MEPNRITESSKYGDNFIMAIFQKSKRKVKTEWNIKKQSSQA